MLIKILINTKQLNDFMSFDYEQKYPQKQRIKSLSNLHCFLLFLKDFKIDAFKNKKVL